MNSDNPQFNNNNLSWSPLPRVEPVIPIEGEITEEYGGEIFVSLTKDLKLP